MRKIYYVLILIFSFSVLSAQEKLSKEEKARREKNIQAGNPFAKYGYKAKVATLSKGKYLEFHDLDSIVTIGTSRWHVDNKKIVGDIVIDSLNVDAQPIGDAPGMWMSPDPLSEEFPSYSPYTMCFDNPLKFVDPDGRAPVDWIRNKYGDYLWDNNATSQATTRGTWEYVGKTLPQGVDREKILTQINGELYHKNSSNLFATIGNALGGNFVEHKPYDPVGEGALREGINTGIGMIAGGYVAKGVGKLTGGLLSKMGATEGMTTVGRWMSQAEYKAMQSTGTMMEGAGGQTFVSTGGPSAFTAAAKGSVYAEFQVSSNSLLQGGQASWFKTIGPNAGKAMQSALEKQGGQVLPKIENLSNILQVK